MRKIWLKNAIVPILYLLVHVYFAIFNWQVFTVNLHIDLGFGVVGFPPFIVLFVIGFILVGILAWVNYVNSLRRLIYGLEQGIEFGKMKEKMVGNRLQEMLFDDKNIEQLKGKMGVRELRRRQEEILLVLNEVKRSQEAQEKQEKEQKEEVSRKEQNQKER